MKKFLYFLSIAFTISLSSCLDILEEISVKKDGSGTYTMALDAVEFMEQMESFAAADTTGEMMPKLKHSLDSSFEESTKIYKDIKGIKNVKLDTSKANVYKITFDFDNVEALNIAMEKGKDDKKAEPVKDMFSFEKGLFKRKDSFNGFDMGALLGGDREEGQDDSQKAMMNSMLEQMKLTTIYHLPKDVKNVNNKDAKISDDKSTVTIETNFKDVAEKKVALGIEIKYKK